MEHVSVIGEIVSFEKENKWRMLVVSLPQTYMKYMTKEGNITLEGVGLTVFDVTANTITCALIPHTYEKTAFRSMRAGDTVNVEPDVLARYIETLHN